MSDARHLFGDARVARGYAAARPRFHSHVIERIEPRLGPVERALDVGCGAGLSTTPLARVARQVVGIDGVRAMVAAAGRDDGGGGDAGRIRYAAGWGEHLPFLPASFGLVSLCGALPWVDRARFLPEAARVLMPRGWLVVYDGMDLFSMVDSDGLAAWHRDTWLPRLPRPPRDERPLSAEEAGSHGFVLESWETYAREWTARLPDYVDFLMTQSNVTAAVGRGDDVEALRRWLRDGLSPLFGDEERRLRFGGPIGLLRRRD